MKKGIIRLGDGTTHGGTVTSATASMIFEGKRVARKGDQVHCPKEGHGTNKIVEGDEDFKDNGIPVAFHGHKSACGCALISSSPDSGIM